MDERKPVGLDQRLLAESYLGSPQIKFRRMRSMDHHAPCGLALKTLSCHWINEMNLIPTTEWVELVPRRDLLLSPIPPHRLRPLAHWKVRKGYCAVCAKCKLSPANLLKGFSVSIHEYSTVLTCVKISAIGCEKARPWADRSFNAGLGFRLFIF